jgi:UDP-N-acetylmuramoyl-tripeptide--D-alanyl-D-alanine ligase
MIKKIFKKIILAIIIPEARLVLFRYRPKIVAVTGSVGKTSAKDAIASVLGQKFFTRKSTKSYNSEIGVPLVILGCETGWLNPFSWLYNIFRGLKLLLAPKKINYPNWLVLEMGVERPGDMARLGSWIKPDIVVFTALSEIPVHVEFFASPESLIQEKMKLIKGFEANRFVILNGDDKTLCEAKPRIQAKTIAFGFDEDNDLKASNYHITYRKEETKEIPEGLTFKVDYKGNSVPVRITGAFGRHHAYSALAALAVGLSQDFNLLDVSETLSQYKSPPGRLKLIEGVKNTFILDDTYNASPIAVHAALDVLEEIPASGRKIAVLGDMLELGKYTVEAHKAVGDRASKVANIIFTVGPRSKFTSEEARAQGFDAKNIFEFSTSDEAKKPLQDLIKEGDLILIKGSQSMRMEKIVEEIMAFPEEAKYTLVRQEKEWRNR